MNTAKIAALLEADAVSLAKLAQALEESEARVQELEEKIASYEHLEECRKVAGMMVERGLSNGQSFNELVENLSAYPGQKIAVMKAAAEMSGPNLYANYAAASPNPTPYGGAPSSVSSSALDAWASGG